MKTIEQFNNKYKEKGGYEKFYKMVYLDNDTQSNISKHFGVRRETVRLWMKNLFGRTFDSRLERRDRKVTYMIEYMKNHSYEEMMEFFKFENKDYIQEALFLANQQGLYDPKDYEQPDFARSIIGQPDQEVSGEQEN